jgi:endonuclease III-like uncharacterized protein
MRDEADKLDEDKRTKLVDKLKKIGIAKEIIDDDMLWAAKKISHKVNGLRLILDEKGISDPKAKEIINKLVAEALEKDLEKVKEWHKVHELDCGGCCLHCDGCHHMHAGHNM